MAGINHGNFARSVGNALEVRGLSFSQAQEEFSGFNRALLSRVRNGYAISAANMLLVCHHLGLDPFDYLDLEKRNIRSQFGVPHKSKVRTGPPVSVVSCETSRTAAET